MKTAIEKFRERVNVNGPIVREELGPCHLWTGYRAHSKWSYGRFYEGGRYVQAHRWIYEQTYGALREGELVLHHCDVPDCVRLEHLYCGSAADNTRDMMERGRHRPARGERQPAAKLSDADADNIRWAYGIGGLTLQTLAKWCGVSYATVQRIVAGKRWLPEKQAA